MLKAIARLPDMVRGPVWKAGRWFWADAAGNSVLSREDR